MAGFGWSIAQLKFFEEFDADAASAILREGTANNSENIISISEDLCYIWCHGKETLIRVLCSDIWMNEKQTRFQEWIFTEHVIFPVTRLNTRKHPGEIVLAWGPTGLAVIKYEPLPGRGLKNCGFTCSILGEKTYIEHPKLRILQVKWHPSTKKDIIGVLNNDNYIRLYDINNLTVPLSFVCVGNNESVPFSYTRHSIGLSEPPVDFEFGPRLGKSGLLVIFVLKSSGAISYHLLLTLETSNKCVWERQHNICADGGLEDAFEDAASILVSKSFPTFVTIGCLNGNLYHTILLPSESDFPDSTILDIEEHFIKGDVTLFVKEILELEPDNERGFMNMRLIHDTLNFHRYACIHDEGVHLINQHFAVNLTRFMGTSGFEGGRNPNLSTQDSQQSSVRYVVCTRTSGDETSVQSTNTNVAFSESIPQKFILFLGNGSSLVYDIPHALNNLNVSMGSFRESSFTPPSLLDGAHESLEEISGSGDGLNILEATKKLLSKDSNQPYLMPSNTEEFPTEKNESVLMNGIRVIKWEYIQRQEQVMNFLMESMKSLQTIVDGLKEPVSDLESNQTALRNTAETMAEQYEEAAEKEEALHKRLEAILFKHHQAFAMTTDDEKKWLRTMETLRVDVGNMRQMVDTLKKGVSVKSPTPPNSSSSGGDTRRVFTDSQITAIREEVVEQHRALAALAHSMKEFEKNLTFP